MGWAHARTADLPSRTGLLSETSGIDSGPVLGDWVNYDRNTPGIARLRIRPLSGGIAVSVIEGGRRWPGGSDETSRGEKPGSVFAGTPDGLIAVGFSATFAFPGADVLLAAYLNLRLLVVDAYVRRPGAPSHFHRDHLYLP